MSVPEIVDGSRWELHQTTDMPPSAACSSVPDASWRATRWHAWNSHGMYCAYHNCIKAPVARVVAFRRRIEQNRGTDP